MFAFEPVSPILNGDFAGEIGLPCLIIHGCMVGLYHSVFGTDLYISVGFIELFFLVIRQFVGLDRPCGLGRTGMFEGFPINGSGPAALAVTAWRARKARREKNQSKS